MFYSETLLQKTGPLARVWLSANIERKLSKTHILQSSVKDSVDAIVNPGQAPMALRLSGQLLLGVVRIYSRKARYLLDDCNEALIKIKMAFRLSNNNDLPMGGHMPSRDALMLPDVLTEGDNLEMPPLPDAAFFLSQMDEQTSSLNRRRRAGSRDINLPDDPTDYLQSSILETRKNRDDDLALDLDDLDLGLDLGDGIIETGYPERSIEIGLDAPDAGPLEDAIGDSELNVFAKDGTGRVRSASIADDFRIMDGDGDVAMDDDMTFGIGDDADVPFAPVVPPRGRISESPLSDMDPEDIERLNDSTFLDAPIERRPAQRAKKLRTLEADEETTLSSAIIKAQQNDRTKILRPQSFLPRDPMLYALMEMQRTGGFVSSVLRDERSAGWAPELRGMLSLDAILGARDLKRKRDSGVADMDLDLNAAKSPRLELDLGDEATLGFVAGMDETAVVDNTIRQLDDDGFQPIIDDDEGFVAAASREGSVEAAANDTFDVTRAPLLHPDEQGAVSLGTKHAVHLLREQFGAEAEHNAAERKKASVVFQDLLPESRTTKEDATKMFFEILVLATKDAVKVEQKSGEVGGAIRVRGKRGLWGSWAEREAGGEIAEEEAAGSEGMMAMAGRTITVGA